MQVQTEEHRAKLVSELLEGEVIEKKKAQAKAQKRRAKQAKGKAKALALCNGKAEKKGEDKEDSPEEGMLPSVAPMHTYFYSPALSDQNKNSSVRHFLEIVPSCLCAPILPHDMKHSLLQHGWSPHHTGNLCNLFQSAHRISHDYLR
jgi:hypothetical protein